MNKFAASVDKFADSVEKKGGKATTATADGMQNFTQSIAAVGAAYVGFRGLTNFLDDSIDASNRFQSSMLGLTSVANNFTGDAAGARAAAQDLAADGLLPLADAATGLKNLLAAGFSLDQATLLMERFKDSAAFGKQGALDFGEAIRGATEGIKNGNSMLVDNAGVTKNLSVILQEAGYSAQDLMRATSDAGVRQALFNGIIRETNAQVGDSAKLMNTAAGADAAFATQMNYLKVSVGDVANTIRQPLVQGLTNFIATNKQAIISIGTGVVAFGSFLAGAYLVVQAVKLMQVSLTLLASHPAIAILSVLFGLMAGMVMNKVITNLSKTAGGMADTGTGAAKAGEGMASASKEAAKLATQLGKLDEQLLMTNRQFREDLAEMVKRMEDNVADYTKQLDQENRNFSASSAERIRQFNLEQQTQAKSHQDKVAKLQTQIDFLRKYNNASNRQQLSELQFALERENAEYQAQADERKLQLDEQTAVETQKHLERVSELQAQLDAEKASLTAHAADVASIRGVQLLDEIDKLKRSHDEQVKALAQQRADTIQNARETAAGVGGVWNGANSALSTQFAGMGNTMGTQMGEAFKNALKESFSDVGKGLWNWWEKTMDTLFGWAGDAGKVSKNAPKLSPLTFRASGGPVSAGQPYIVGEQGPEAFMPKQSGTIIPNDKLGALRGVNVTVHMSGIMTSSPADERAIAGRLMERINESLRAKGAAQIGVA